MKETSETPVLNREEIKFRLEEIIRRDPENGPKQLALFAARCGLRVLPLLAKEDGSGFWFKGEPRKHLVACWRALMIPLYLVAGRKAAARAAADNAADNAAAAATTAARATVDAAAYAAYAARAARAASVRARARARARGDAADAADAAARAARAAAKYVVISSIKSDLSSLEAKDGLALTDPLWSIDSPSTENPLEKHTEVFLKACRNLGLDRIADSYQALLDGGEAAISVADQDFEFWDDLWEEVQKYPDFPPDAELETTVEPKTETETEPEPEDSIETLGSDYVFKPSSSILYETDATEDRLSRGPLVSALASWIGDKTNNSHITLGLFGNWGAGKSTFLNLLRQQLGAAETSSEQSSGSTPETIKPEAIENGELRIIWGEFNAWRYEQCDNIQAGVAQEVVKSLKSSLGWGDQIVLTISYAVKKHSWRVAAAFLVVLITVLGWASVDSIKDMEPGAALLAIVAQALLGGAFFTQVKQAFSQPMAKELNTYLRLPSFGKHLGSVPVMREQIHTLVQQRQHLKSKTMTEWFAGIKKYGNRPIQEFWSFARRKPVQRYVFVVDDLDRCSQEGVVQTLEAIRLVMDIPNVVVILAIDPRIALASLAQKYEGLSEHHGADPLTIARDYLGKVIHAPIVLEEPPKADIKSYLDHLWQTAGEEAQPLQGEPKKEVKKGVLSERSNQQPNKASNKQKAERDPSAAPEDEPLTPPENPNVALPSTEKAENPKHQTQEPETPEPQISAPQLTTVTGLSDTQKTAFVDWISRFGFSNPRQIKRLNNAYSLLRLRYSDEDQTLSLVGESEPGTVPVFPRLVMLLWLEYLHELPATIRCELLKPLQKPTFDETNWHERQKNQDAGQPSFAELNQEKIELWEAVKKALKGEEIGEVYLQVRGFVLPAVNPVDTAL